MKAIIVPAYGPIQTLRYADWPEPQAKGDAVVIEARAIGVNYPDGLLVQGLYQERPDVPFVPGMEVAGTVAAVGEAVRGIRPGDRVSALMTTGGYAERVAVPAGTVTKLPDEVGYEDACALLCGYGTSYHALKQRAALAAGETLCVLGAAGATGIAAVQIGKAMGARVIGVASTREKQALAQRAGADVVIGYEGLKDELKRITAGKGVDVAFDPVGGEAFDALTRAMAWNGRLLVIGFASGTIAKFPTNLALLKGYSVVGVFWGGFTRHEPQANAGNMEELLRLRLEGKIAPLIEGIYPLAEAAGVLERVLGRDTAGKVILKP